MQTSTRLERFPTGVPGFDDVLMGGFFAGGVNLVAGPPGSGKTLLAAQIAFHHAASGHGVVYLTVLTEPHARMLEHLRAMRFFEERLIPDRLYFVSGYRELEQDGLPALLRLIQATVRDRRASLLVLDGLSGTASLAASAFERQKFVYELNALLTALRCTALLLSTGDGVLSEEAMVESITLLDTREVGLRSLRRLRVAKLRGGEFLEGFHHYLTSAEGVRVYPRTESIAARRAAGGEEQGPVRPRLSFGVPPLDAMLAGGIPALTATALLGAPGSGKTVLGSSFLLAGAAAGERGVYFGFSETPERLAAKLHALGLPVRDQVERDLVALRWNSPVERLVDALADRLLAAVRSQRATRVFVDGVDVFREVAAAPERLPAFLIALTAELRSQGATTLFSEECEAFVPLEGIAASVDNIIFLRYVERRARLDRMLSIVKLRDSAYDSSLRELRFGPGGISVSGPFAMAERVAAGVAPARERTLRGRPASAAKKTPSRRK